MPSVRLLTGTARSDRASRIDRLLIERLDESLLIVPTRDYAERRTADVLEASGRPGFLHSPVVTFQNFVTRILEGAPGDHAKLAALEQRVIIERALQGARGGGALDALGGAEDTEGFADHLLHVITQIKQAEVTPDALAEAFGRRGRNAPVDRAVATVYEAYQHELKRTGVVDLPGMYWLARIECEKDEPPAGLEHVRRLLLDGFDDFTPSEFSLIGAAARHLEELVFGLHYDADPRQKNLYALPRNTNDMIRGTFGQNLEVPQVDELPPQTESEFVAQSLLRRDHPEPPGNLRRDLTLVECHTIDQEVETIARQVKRLVRENKVPLSEIAVVWRRVPPVAGIVRDVFSEYGIPVRGVHRRPLAGSALAAFVLQFLQAAQSWTLPDVLDVLTSPWFAGPDAAHTGRFPILARAARPTPAPEAWTASIDRLRDGLGNPPNRELSDLVEHVPDAAAAASDLSASVQRFAVQARRFSQPRTTHAFLESLAALLAEWPIDDALASLPSDDQERAFEEASWRALRNQVGELIAWHDPGEAAASCSDFVNLLKRAFQMCDVSTDAPKGAVACLDMESARYLEFDHVFLAGMTQGEVPEPAPVSAIYNDSERAELRGVGVPLDQADTHSQREILLFQRMFTTARNALVISWHGLTRGGQAAGPSLFLEEVIALLGLTAQRAADPKDVLVPSPDRVGCERDRRNFAFAGPVSPSERARHYPRHATAAAVEQRRHAPAPCDRYDGVLEDPDNLRRLENTYGDQHLFSVSRLEVYADCPFRFFQERVLKLFNIEPPEQAFDHLARGSVLHDALEAFHRRFPERAVPDIPPEEAAAAMRACAEAAFKRTARRYSHLGAGLLEAEKTRTIATLQHYLAIERERAQERSWKPVHFEVAFGDDHGPDTVSLPPPYTMTLDGSDVRIAGRIDRVDTDGGALRLVDYKRSKTTNKDIEDGNVFQLAVYALAAEEHLFPETTCREAVYLAVGQPHGHTTALSRDRDRYAWDERVGIAREAVAAAVAGIREGRFPPTSEASPCKGCAAEGVCRYQRARMLRKRDGQA